MLRLLLHCDDRQGLTQEVLTLLLKFSFDLRGIELLEHKLYLKLIERDADQIIRLMSELSLVKGIIAVKKVSLLPAEKEHLELTQLLFHFPEAVALIDSTAKVITANPAFFKFFEIDPGCPTELGELFEFAEIKDLLVWSNSTEGKQQALVYKGRTVLLECLGLNSNLDETEHPDACSNLGAVIVFREPSQMVKQMDRWQRAKTLTFAELIAHSETMRSIVEDAYTMAHLDAPLLISGETGTGKELFARAIHQERTATQPFIAVNCAALPDNVAEQELFGASPTSKLPDHRPGLLELANGGTLYFDKIGEMSPYLQVKLLRFLEEGSFRRVGTDQEIRVNVRVIASTQIDLLMLCKQKRFREDLYYRLNVLSIHLPPLRNRKSDIEFLANYFIELICKKMNRPTCELTFRARQVLKRYNWPGNIRELENTIFRSVSLSQNNTINTRHLKMPMLKLIDQEFESSELEVEDLKTLMQRYEKRLLSYLFPLYPSSRKLATHLGLSHTAVANKLRAYKITQ